MCVILRRVRARGRRVSACRAYNVWCREFFLALIMNLACGGVFFREKTKKKEKKSPVIGA